MDRKATAPWYRKGRDMWLTTIDGKQVPLGISGEQNQAAALAALQQLLASVAAPPKPTAPLGPLVKAHLERAALRVKPQTLIWMRQFLDRLVTELGAVRDSATITAATATAVIGIDVSKATIDVCLLTPDGKDRDKAFPNTPDGFAALLAWADRHAGGTDAPVGMEATGGYEDALATFLHTAGRTVSVVNRPASRTLG
jgi:hypothetical protein